DFFQILRKPQNWCDRARPGVADAGSSGRAAGAHRRTAIFRRGDSRGNSRVTKNFAGHSETGLDPGENLASARTVCELGIQILRGYKNYPIPAREHRSATLGSLEKHPGRSVGTKLFRGPDCPGGATLRSRYGFA